MLANKDKKNVALVAPSFPAEFTELEDYRLLVGMVRKLGFDKVMEVSFGADLVARQYKKLLESENQGDYISSDCPAIVFYIEHYHPGLVSHLAPIASPMVAISRLARHLHGEDINTVFIGPCIAKKAESDEIDVALTFSELREMFEKYSITPDKVEPSYFDGPASGMGALFPLSRGLLQNVKKSDNIVEGNIIVDSGKTRFKEAISELERGEIAGNNLELLCCNGCIMGPGMTDRENFYYKWSQIGKYVKAKLQGIDTQKWRDDLEKYGEIIDLSQKHMPLDRRIERPEEQEVEKVLREMGKEDESDLLDCGACGYETCREHAVAVVQGFAEDKMCLPYTIERLHQYIERLNLTNEKLKNTKLELRHSEKLAHMGQIAAGIAHELNNPLGVITMYSNIIYEELEENDPKRDEADLIVKQADRCKKIVSGLLNFARSNKTKLRKTDMAELVNRSLESVVIPSNVQVSVDSDLDDTMAAVDQEQMMQVLTNLEKNAVEAMPDGGELKVHLSGNKEKIHISITDTGCGIPEENKEKLFTPFFTTKDLGKGTGLGLPQVHGIVKMHQGKINVKSNTEPEKGPTGTEFIITIPRNI